VVFAYSGAVAGVEAMHRRIYSEWFPRASVVPDDFTAIDHYTQDAPVGGMADFEIWIKVRARIAS